MIGTVARGVVNVSEDVITSAIVQEVASSSVPDPIVRFPKSRGVDPHIHERELVLARTAGWNDCVVKVLSMIDAQIVRGPAAEAESLRGFRGYLVNLTE